MKRLLVLLVAAGLAGPVGADEPVPPPVAIPDTLAVPAAPGTAVPDAGAGRQTSVASPEPPRAALTARWRLRPFLGPTTVRLAGLDVFPQAAIALYKYNNAPFTDQKRHDVSLAFLEGAEATYLIDPLVSVGARLAWLRTELGTTYATGSNAGYRNQDWWRYQSEVLLAMAGAGFMLPVTEHTRAIVDLYLGAGLGTVRIDHRTLKSYPSGNSDLEQASAEGTGTGFFPEFTIELEHDLSEALSAQVALGYRFGAIGSFSQAYDTSVNGFGPFTEARQGQSMRSADRTVLGVNYGGLVLAVSLAARL